MEKRGGLRRLLLCKEKQRRQIFISLSVQNKRLYIIGGCNGAGKTTADTIVRRYYAGLKNLFGLYENICDLILLYDNSKSSPELIFEKSIGNSDIVYNNEKFKQIKLMLA